MTSYKNKDPDGLISDTRPWPYNRGNTVCIRRNRLHTSHFNTVTLFDIMQYPVENDKSSKRHKIPCQVEVAMWLGKMAEEKHFKFDDQEDLSVNVETVRALEI